MVVRALSIGTTVATLFVEEMAGYPLEVVAAWFFLGKMLKEEALCPSGGEGYGIGKMKCEPGIRRRRGV